VHERKHRAVLAARPFATVVRDYGLVAAGSHPIPARHWQPEHGIIWRWHFAAENATTLRILWYIAV
jgi:hypothetical protein